MTTPREYARSATAALNQVLHISARTISMPNETAAVIEQAIRNATREREKQGPSAVEGGAGCGAGASDAIAELVACGDLQLQGDRRFCADLRQRQYQGRVRLRSPRSTSRTRPSGATGSTPTTWPASRTRYPQFFQNGVHTVEYRFRRKDGSYCWVNDEQHLIRDGDGEPVEIVGSWSDITARKAIGEAQAAAQDRVGRQLLASSPAVIYSYKATGDFAPTFVSQNIRDWLGYEPQEYLENADFWRRCVHPDDLAAVEAAVRPAVQERPPHGRVSISQEGRHLLLGERRTAPDPGRGRPTDRGGRLMERHHRAQASGGSRGGGPGSHRAPARQLAGGDLQLQGNRRLRADVHQPEREGPARV